MNTQVGKSIGIALLLAAGLIAALFATGVFAPTGASAQANNTPSLTLSPKMGGKGTMVTVTGENLSKGKPYNIVANFADAEDNNVNDDDVLAAGTSSSMGSLSLSFTVPDTAVRGTITITASDVSTSTSGRSPSADFTVTFPTEIKATPDKVDNTTARTVQLTATSFAASAAITFSHDGGSTVTLDPANGEVTANSGTGDVDSGMALNIPLDHPAGTITVTAMAGTGDSAVSKTTTVTVTEASVMVSPSPLEANKEQLITVTGMNFPKGAVDFTSTPASGVIPDSSTAMVGDDGTFSKQLVLANQSIGEFTIIATEGNNSEAEVGGMENTSAMVKVEAKPAALAPVTGLTLIAGTDMLTATWVASTGADDYTVRWRSVTQDWADDRTAMATSNLHEITGLTGGMGYWVEVKPNKAGHLESTYTASMGTPMAVVEEPPQTPPSMKGAFPSDDKAGAAVRIEINADAMSVIHGGEDIVVELPKFGLPDSIDESDVLISSAVATGYSGNPSDVTVSGSKVTIEVPAREASAQGGSGRTNIPVGDYSIKIKQSAGITNPVAAGSQTITVTDKDAMSEEYGVTIMHVVSLSEDEVTRGDDLTLTIKGFANGTATVSINGDEVGQTEVSGNVGEFAIDTSASTVKAGQDNMVTVVDSKGADGMMASDSFTIKEKVTVDPDETTPATKVEVSLSDWPANRNIKSVTVGGTPVVEKVNAMTDGDGAASFDVTVPSSAKTGSQTLTVTGGDASASTTIKISVLELSVSPSTAVPGAQITITGSGFVEDTDVTDSIMVGGKKAYRPSDARTTSDGRVAVTVTVPLDVGNGDKTVELTVRDRTGEGEITVPKPSITLDPAESVPGSIISVNGSGFDSNGRFEVKYDGQVEEVGKADSSGNFSIRLTVPSNAGIGQDNPVLVQSRTDKADGVNATADHSTPGQMIMVTEEVQVGTLMTISGTNFTVFSPLTVKIGTHNVTPTVAETDKNGAFEITARVPRLSAGSHSITVTDGARISSTETFTVVTTPVVSTPAEVFGGLGDNLQVVWRYNNADQSWASYSPGAPAELNDLTGVSRGDIVWIEVTEEAMFQGMTIYAGWNLITLE